MPYVIVAAALILLAVYLSFRIRIAKIVAARQSLSGFEEISSPLSESIKDFVAIAGGVYLGLMALAEFLKVPVPLKTEIWGTSFDPIALFSVCLAVIAPVLPFRKSKF